MSNNLCIIDDGFLHAGGGTLGITNEKIFDSSSVKAMLQVNANWNNEISLYKLCERVVSDRDAQRQEKWSLLAFSNPRHYLDAFYNKNSRSDVIVYDWHYPVEIPHAEILRNIFENSHSFVYIFTGDEERAGVENYFEEYLSEFKNRYSYYPKNNAVDNDEAYQALYTSIEERYSNNFAFKFGHELRKVLNRSLDNVLLQLSSMNIEKVIACLGKPNGEPIDSDLKELIGVKIKDSIRESWLSKFLFEARSLVHSKAVELLEFISEKTKNDIMEAALPHQRTQTNEENDEDTRMMRSLWSYRLYHKPHNDDRFVRTGDIIKKNTDADYAELYLVITPLCQLEKFWGKTHGCLNLVKLYSVAQRKVLLKERGSLTKKGSSLKNIGEISSISNSIDVYGGSPLYVPYIPIDTSLQDYLMFPKEISAESIEMPTAQKQLESIKDRDSFLSYEILPYERVISISEPFLSPVIEHIFSALKGYGAPDFASKLKTDLQKSYAGIFE